jgi:hypothetical protein
MQSKFPVALVYGTSFLLLLVFGWGPNLGLLLLSLIVLWTGAWLCWRPGEPGVVLFLFGYQWLQASLSIFVANVRGVPINQVAQQSDANMFAATALTLVGLVVIFGCFRITAGNSKRWVISKARDETEYVSVRQLAIAFVLAKLLQFFLLFLSTLSAGLSQPFYAFATLTDAVFVILAYVAFVRGGQFLGLFYAAFAFELLSSLGGYFSSFQTVFVYTFIAAVGAKLRLKPFQITSLLGLICTAILLASAWSAIKPAYRLYVNNNTGQQIVTVGWYDAVGKLSDLAFDLDQDDLLYGADTLTRRLTYVEFFGSTLNYVPYAEQHTNGELWLTAVVHPFTPRLLFPNKPITDSSAITNKYSGQRVAGWESGTQVSIGYFGESYIDFGILGMFVPLAIYGAIAGTIYRRVLTIKRFAGLISFGLVVPLMMGATHIGSETQKIVGHLLLVTIAIYVSRAFLSNFIICLIFGNRRFRRE